MPQEAAKRNKAPVETTAATFRRVYGETDSFLRNSLCAELGESYTDHVHQVIDHGITHVTGLFSPDDICAMQVDLDAWTSTKRWNKDRHMSFDGNSGESYLPKSVLMSAAVADPVILSLVTGVFGQHPRLSFVRTYRIDPIEPYDRRAFHWHHDGWGPHGLKVMILLSDVGEQGQAMRFCPGTHFFDWRTSRSKETQFTQEYASLFKQLTCCGAAGDVYVFNPHALHRGVRNLSARRDVIVINFQPGSGRNYPLPGLHSRVVEGLDDYERCAYRVDEPETSVESDLDRFYHGLARLRSLQQSLFGKHVLPAQQVRQRISRPAASVELRTATEHNRSLDALPAGYVAENVVPTASVIQEQLDRLDAGLPSGSMPDVPCSAEFLRSVVEADLHADLDLPIRMDHPFADQLRDTAITHTRDGDAGEHFSRLYARLATDNGPCGVRSIWALESAAETAELIGRRPGRGGTRLDCFYYLALDLDEMLQRSPSLSVVRRNLLYTGYALDFLLETLQETGAPIPERQPVVERIIWVVEIYKRLARVQADSDAARSSIPG